MSNSLPPRLLRAASIVREAALLAREIRYSLVSPAIEKDDRSPVTVADYAVQAVVSARLAEEWPDDPLVGEESADLLASDSNADALNQVVRFIKLALGTDDPQQVCQWIQRGAADAGGSFWTLDPIDGTKGFLRGDQYAVALAYVSHDGVQLGVLGCPNLSLLKDAQHVGQGSLIVASGGKGAWLLPLELEPTAINATWTRLEVSKCDVPAEARVLRSVEAAHTNKGQAGDLSQAFGTKVPPVGMDSQAKYAALAAGDAELLVRLISPSRPDYREKIWDQAAGSIVIEEAGGHVTDLDGQPLDFSHGRTLATNRGVLATNGQLHVAALDAIRTIGA